MIIYLTQELINSCQLNSENPTRVIFFENLAITRRDGKHFVIGDRVVFDFLRNLNGLTDLAKSIYDRIYKRFATEMTILSADSFVFKIGVTNLVEDHILTFHINELSDDSFASFNNLLLENSVDTFIYEKAIDYYKDKNNLSQINWSWDIRNGGGSTSHAEFLRLSNLKTAYTFAILDSDKICPNSALGGTASQFLETNTLFGSYHILDAHEIENLVPRQIYAQYIDSKNDGNLNHNLTILNSNSNIIQFIDIKKGVKKHKLFYGDQLTRQYYCVEYNIQEHDLNCGCATVNNCNCFLFYPMSRPIFSLIKSFIDQENINLLDFISGFLEAIYFNLGKKLFWFFCKTNRISVS